jgi:glutathione synthase
MLAAQARGHKLWHYDVRSLAWENGRITAWARPVTVQRVVGDHHGFEGERRRSTSPPTSTSC